MVNKVVNTSNEYQCNTDKNAFGEIYFIQYKNGIINKSGEGEEYKCK